MEQEWELKNLKTALAALDRTIQLLLKPMGIDEDGQGKNEVGQKHLSRKEKNRRFKFHPHIVVDYTNGELTQHLLGKLKEESVLHRIH